MSKIANLALFTGIVLAAAVLIYVFPKGEEILVLSPKGIIASEQRSLLFYATLLMLIVLIPVYILLLWFSRKYRSGNHKATYTPDWDHSLAAECVWWGVPLIIIVVLSVMTWRSSHRLDPFKPIVSERAALRIQAVALEWKWLFLYPDQGIASLNFVQFPEKTPIQFEITADAPMNSFWIPQLGGQIYAMPGMKSQLHLMASETGEFRGSSANLSGKGFSGMHFKAVSVSRDDFDAWAEGVERNSAPLGAAEYEQLLIPSKNDSPSFYTLTQKDLFDQIIMKYMHPAKE